MCRQMGMKDSHMIKRNTGMVNNLRTNAVFCVFRNGGIRLVVLPRALLGAMADLVKELRDAVFYKLVVRRVCSREETLYVRHRRRHIVLIGS